MSLHGSLEPSTLYIALKCRPIVDEYHWALILTDSDSTPTLHHTTNVAGPWRYIAEEITPAYYQALIAIVRVDAVKNYARAVELIEACPAAGDPSLRTGDAFNCRVWVKDVLVALDEQNEITLNNDIDELERKAADYGHEYRGRCERGDGATVINDSI